MACSSNSSERIVVLLPRAAGVIALVGVNLGIQYRHDVP
jgi:hypothetical protein